MQKEITFEELSEEVIDDDIPPLDKMMRGVAPVELSWQQQQWVNDGLVIMKKFIPDEVMAPYIRLREKLDRPGGWAGPTPYMYFDEIKDLALYRPLMETLKHLLSAEMALHLNLTGWVSTERAWHQDDYLNPEFIKSWYAAVWIALDDIHPDSGPFEYVPGSHKWPLMRRSKVFQHMTDEEKKSAFWPSIAEKFVTPAMEAEIAKRGITPQRFIASKGDVLIWHGRLVHQGSKPKVRGMPRKALISHYSAISKRRDMHLVERWRTGGSYFVLNVPLEGNESSRVN